MDCQSQVFILGGGRLVEEKKKKNASPSLGGARSRPPAKRGTEIHNTGSTTYHSP